MKVLSQRGGARDSSQGGRLAREGAPLLVTGRSSECYAG